MTEVVIDWQSLSAEALVGVIEEFVTREGTEYGVGVITLAEKCAAVQDQIKTGKAQITFDADMLTCSIRLVG